MLASELKESADGFPFPGIEPALYAEIKAEEEKFEGYPGLATPVDKIIERMKDEGIKIVFGDDTEMNNIYVLPQNSSNYDDSLFLRHLLNGSGMDGRLNRLIELSKEKYNERFG